MICVGCRRATSAVPRKSWRWMMRTLGKSTVLGVALLAGAAIAAAGTAAAAAVQSADASHSTPNRVALPEVTVYPQPYDSGVGPRANSFSTPRTEHYLPPPDFAANIALHPYTSGALARASSHATVRDEHYQVPPDFDANLGMHPYTSAISPCLVGSNAPCQAPPSHHNRKTSAP